MVFFNDTFFRNCGRFSTKKEWGKHIYSSRQLHREVKRYLPASFPEKKTN